MTKSDSGSISYGQNGETREADIPGVGHPGSGPDIRDLMSRNLRDFALQEPDVWLGARMSSLTIPDRDLDFEI